MSKEPIFISGVTIAKGQGFVLAGLNAPTGDMKEGQVETTEIVRVVMSASTLKSVCELLVAACRELDPLGAAGPLMGGSAPRVVAPADLDDDDPGDLAFAVLKH